MLGGGLGVYSSTMVPALQGISSDSVAHRSLIPTLGMRTEGEDRGSVHLRVDGPLLHQTAAKLGALQDLDYSRR